MTEEKFRQVYDAKMLLRSQTVSAQVLKNTEDSMATELQDTQLKQGGGRLSELQNLTAMLLLKVQRKRAGALKQSNADHAGRLKAAQEGASEQINQKNQIIAWLTGGYSVSKNDE